MKNKIITILIGVAVLMLAGLYTMSYFGTGTLTSIDHVETYNETDFSNAHGITMDKDYFWITDDGTHEVIQLYHDMTPTGFSFDISNFGCTNSQGIEMDDTHFFIVDQADDEVYITLHDGTYVDSFDIAVSSIREPMGITMDDDYFWIADSKGDVWKSANVYKFHHNGTFIGFAFNTMPSGMTQPTGITIHNGNFLIANMDDDVKSNNLIYEFEPNGTFIRTYDIMLGTHAPMYWGMTSDDTNLWIIEYWYETVEKYHLNME